ncbi:nitrogen regulation protein NR(I) [Vibrio parahaemolyticus]|uniref:sigma 54-interacting transcriptional regulator n=1 Tax=Vibrio parahaemolyticus TaxID=670 RepID=UPI0011221C39|nr:sigma 54-interacting transcriptional regulator [Vibrio parahaemolyticus]TOO68072.1 nitrogen regulation protein NR(I) [Vibrio parahaemolyticus]
MSKGYVWVVDDDSSIRWVMEKTLSSANIKCETYADGESVLMALEREVPDVLVSDIRMPGIDGLELLKQVQRDYPDLPVIIMTAHSDLDAAVNAYQKGAFEYLPKPFDIDETLTLVERAIAHSHENKREQLSSEDAPADTPEIIGEAPAMQVAHALHRHSPRANKPFIALNMAAIPKDLIESELFGHEKGAFTGANSVRQGRFEQANGGTLFLDEIGDMPLDIQTRLLRVLADGQFYRVGGHSPIRVDVRIVAATHQNLEKLVHQGDFREDLFHRLNVIRVQIPALRERKQDIEKLTQHFLVRAADELGVETKTLHPSTVEILNRLNWPGNVRQLENICRWLTVMASGSEVLPNDLPSELLEEKKTVSDSTKGSWQEQLADWARQSLAAGDKELLSFALPEFERILLEAALEHTKGHKQDAAKVLGWGRNTLTRKLKELY